MRNLILYNPFSGRGFFEKKIYILKKLLEKRNEEVNVCYSEYEKSLKDKAFCEGMNYDRFIVIGGDGTLNEVVNGLMRLEKKPAILYIPNGTVNDVGHVLGLTRNVKKIMKLLDTEPVLRDVGKVNNRFFCYASAAGKFSNLSYGTKHRTAKKIFGKFYYFTRAFKDLFKDEYRIKVNDEYVGPCVLFFVVNNARLGSMWIHKINEIKLNDGMIDLYVFKSKSILSFVNLFNFLLFGDLAKHNISEYYGNHFDIELDRSTVINIDGEASIESDHFVVDVIKEALPFYVSKKAKKKYF